ncbi:MAG: hypothetical protein KGO50_03720 [Myxococcales bacterium]|nr:hypothetical protein [Myxococcales bacterium]
MTGSNYRATGSNWTQASLTVAPDDAIALLTRAVDLMSACVAQTRLYGPGHPEATRIIDQLHHVMEAAIASLGPVELRVLSDGFWYGQQQVTLEKDDRPGLANYLHTEGLARLRFDPGLTRDELVRLLLVLRINLSLPAYEEETLESILYQSEFQHIAFEAVHHLMNAEALSGRMEELDSAAMLEQLLRLQADRERDLARSLGDRNTDSGARMRRDDLHAEDSDWDAQLARTEDEDIRALAPERERLDMERDGDHVARLGTLLLRSIVAGDPVMPPSLAMSMAQQVVQQLYAMGDATALLGFIEDAHGLARTMDDMAPAASQDIHELVRNSLIPMRIARMLRVLRMDDARDVYTFSRFVSRFTPEVLIVFLDGLVTENTGAESRAMQETFWSLVDERLLSILDTPETSPQTMVTILHAALTCNIRLPDALRATLMRHRSALVRTAVLPFYREQLPADEVVEIASLVSDRVATVRKAALDILARHRPRNAGPVLTGLIEREDFPDANVSIKTDLCQGLARVLGPSSIDFLGNLLNMRSGLLADPRDASTMEAAARALASLRNPVAQRLLEKGASAWSGPRRAACALALQEMRNAGETP